PARSSGRGRRARRRAWSAATAAGSASRASRSRRRRGGRRVRSTRGKCCATGRRSVRAPGHERGGEPAMDILILGVNGFIGSHLTSAVLQRTDWRVFGMDLDSDRVAKWLDHPRFRFLEGDIAINKEWIEYHVRKCDVCLPLVAIATPAAYVKTPLAVF